MIPDIHPPPLLRVDDIRAAQPISGWEDFLQEGEAYLQTASGAHAHGRRAFTPVILYNIIAMAIEKSVMAVLMKHGALPYNHTMVDLVFAMDDLFPEYIAAIRDDLLALDSYQEICDVDGFSITPPAPDKIPAMLSLAHALQELVHTKIREVCA